MKFEVPFGGSTVPVSTPSKGEILLPGGPVTADGGAVLLDAIASPLDSPPASDFIAGAARLLVVVNDATRPTPTAAVLSLLEPHLASHPDVRFLVATGTHRGPTEEEYARIFGGTLEKFRDRVSAHDCRDEGALEDFGTTSRGTPVRLNSLVSRADRVLVVGSVKPHYFAGFTGGRKAFLPGVAAFATIEANHALALSEHSAPMRLSGNPLAEDMEEAARMAVEGRVFSVQAAMTYDHRVAAAAAGDLFSSFGSAACAARDMYGAPPGRRGNIVVTANPPPFDINLYQAQHAIENALLALEDGGILILVSTCREGVGNPAFLEHFDGVETWEDAGPVMERGYRLGQHKLARVLKAKAQRGVRVWAVTGLDDDTVRRAKMEPKRAVQDALDEAVEAVVSTGNEPYIVAMPAGGITVPLR